jgi:hypothetical protein
MSALKKLLFLIQVGNANVDIMVNKAAQELGALGGQTTVKKYGPDHFSLMGKKGRKKGIKKPRKKGVFYAQENQN